MYCIVCSVPLNLPVTPGSAHISQDMSGPIKVMPTVRVVSHEIRQKLVENFRICAYIVSCSFMKLKRVFPGDTRPIRKIRFESPVNQSCIHSHGLEIPYKGCIPESGHGAKRVYPHKAIVFMPTGKSVSSHYFDGFQIKFPCYINPHPSPITGLSSTSFTRAAIEPDRDVLNPGYAAVVMKVPCSRCM